MTSLARLTKAMPAAMLLFAVGCGITDTESEDDETDLQTAEQRWVRSGVQDYQIVVRHLCFCGYVRPVRLTVRSGSIVSRVDAETGEPVPSHGSHIGAVPDLFDIVREAIERDAHSLSVTYDATYGFPTQINIDYIGNAVDDELQVSASQFQPAR
jgi:Family of unknown function (DUF6174)